MSGKHIIDEEDIMECKCYMIFCITPNNGLYTDRVYRDRGLAEKRVDFLNLISKERGQWMAVLSELGK